MINIKTYFFILFSILISSLIFSTNAVCQKYSVSPAVSDPNLTSFTGGFIIYLYDTSLTNGESQFVFQPNSVTYELGATSASIQGKLMGKDSQNSQNGFDFQLTLSLALESHSGMIEFYPSVQVDTSSWLYYTISTPSILSGFGTYSGLEFTIIQQKSDFPFQLGFGANGKNLNFGAATWFTLVSADGNTRINGDLNVDINMNNCPSLCPSANNMTASASQVDSYANFTGGVAFSFFDAPSSIGSNSWVFSANSGELMENGDMLHLTGMIMPKDGSSNTLFMVNLLFRKAPASYMPMEMHQELMSNAYKENGGPIDSSLWSYYFIDSAASMISNDNGVMITLSTFMDMPLQVGIGANGKNIHFGASGWFNYIVSGDSTVYKMDINIDLDCPDFPNSDSSDSSSSSSSGDSDCSILVSANLRTSWLDNGRNITLWDISLTNSGSKTILDANVKFIFPSSVDCSTFASGSCTLNLWNLDRDASGNLHLPEWLTKYRQLPIGSTHVFGVISLITDVRFDIQSIC